MSEVPDSRQAWDAFWQQGNRTGGNPTGCLPGGNKGITGAQMAVWSALASTLPQDARVLDIATGDGRVMEWMLAARPDLKPEGIDQASNLPPAPRSAVMHAGVLMHQLPFDDACFAAVTSQFGFEYGEVEEAANEVFRVLAPGGTVAMITHRTDSPIVSHNLMRQEQIRWVIEERDLPAIATRSLHTGATSVPAELASAPDEGARRFGSGSAAWEIAEAIRRALQFGRNASPPRTAAVIDQIATQARGEIGRIASLQQAAERAGTGEKVARLLEDAGLQGQGCEPLYDGNSSQPIATVLKLTKPA